MPSSGWARLSVATKAWPQPPWAHSGFSLHSRWKTWEGFCGGFWVGTFFEWMNEWMESSLTWGPGRCPRSWNIGHVYCFDSLCLGVHCCTWAREIFVKSVPLITLSYIWRCCSSNEINSGVTGLYKGVQALTTEKVCLSVLQTDPRGLEPDLGPVNIGSKKLSWPVWDDSPHTGPNSLTLQGPEANLAGFPLSSAWIIIGIWEGLFLSYSL